MIRLALAAVALAVLVGCADNAFVGVPEGDGGCGQLDAGAFTCRACVTGNDCDPCGSCTQYSGDSFCAKSCADAADCAPSEDCVSASDFAGQQVRVCLPRSGTCAPGADAGCGSCPSGTSCDLTLGTCEASPDAGGPVDGGLCGTKAPPATPSCCKSCDAGVGSCAANGCYGGWWCDQANPSNCACRPAPTSCGPPDAGTFDAGFFDAGFFDAGVFDAGPPRDGGPIGPNGGSVALMFFAVVGDTRPPSTTNAVANYPTAVITKIYADIAAMRPMPQFVIATGDYQFSSTSTSDAAAQFALYLGARNQFPSTVFAAMGNHECTSATASNCVGSFARANFDAYLAALVTPLGKSVPYYSVPIWTSRGSVKIIVAACNAWDATQKAWLQAELSSGPTYKFIVRHESIAATAPCTAEMNPMIAASGYNLMIVGHTHLYSQRGVELIVGMGGAPISGSTPFGYITVEQLAAGGWHVNQYDSTTSMLVSSVTIP